DFLEKRRNVLRQAPTVKIIDRNILQQRLGSICDQNRDLLLGRSDLSLLQSGRWIEAQASKRRRRVWGHLRRARGRSAGAGFRPRPAAIPRKDVVFTKRCFFLIDIIRHDYVTQIRRVDFLDEISVQEGLHHYDRKQRDQHDGVDERRQPL